MVERFSTLMEFNLSLFNWLLRLTPKKFRGQFGKEMQITFRKICANQELSEGNIGLVNELIHTIWDMGKAILFLHIWFVIDLGNKKIFSISSYALLLAGITYISPICPIHLRGGNNVQS